MPRFARLVARFIAIGSTLLLPRNSHAAEAENAEPWRAVTRIRGSATLEYQSWIRGEDRESAEFTDTAQVHFVLVLDRGEEVAMPPNLPPEMAAAMRSAIAAERASSAQMTWRAESAVITGTLRHESTVVNQGHTSGTAEFTGEPVSLKDFFFELTPATGVWQIVTPGILREKYQITYVTTGKDAHTDYGTHDGVESEVFDGTVKGKPSTISLTNRHEGQLDQKPTRGFTKVAKLRLWPEMADADVEVTIDGYAKWRPEGSIAEPTKPGNHLVARATLVPKGGARIQDLPAVKNFRFELLDTSREPGVCLNWPLKAKDDDYDLRLAAAPPFAAELSDKDQNSEISQPLNDAQGRPYAESQIDSYDFGGRCSLRVLCKLADGREIIGIMKDGGAGQDLVRIPKMNGPGWIADSWRKEMKAEKLADDDDDEKVDGQTDNGDGFTLYEEYRGWVEKGKHIEGDPLKKDFFVRNLIGADARGGIALFERVSKLQVHSQLRESEMIILPVVEMESVANAKGERIMNLNHRDGPHRVDQHGVYMINTNGFRSSGGGTEGVASDDKVNRAFRPGKVKVIHLEERGWTNGIFSQHASITDYNLSERDAAFAYDRGVAHELLHAVGVDHHGEGESPEMLYFQGAGDPMNTAHVPRFVPYMPATDSAFGAPMTRSRPTVWSDFDRGPTVTLRWEDTKENVAQSLSADFERALTAERNDPLNDRDGSAQAAKYPQYGKDALFWSEMSLYNSVSKGTTKRGYLNAEANQFDRLVIIGREHQADSGNELCLMRYYFANAYPVDASETAFYLVRPGKNHVGRELCKSPAGTGQNAPDHDPKSRFGDSAPGRGGCFGYVCPNDAIPPRTL